MMHLRRRRYCLFLRLLYSCGCKKIEGANNVYTYNAERPREVRKKVSLYAKGESVIARNLETTYQEVLNTIHPHPTLSEAIMEATADAYEEGIHI